MQKQLERIEQSLRSPSSLQLDADARRRAGTPVDLSETEHEDAIEDHDHGLDPAGWN